MGKFYTAKYDRVFKAIFCDEDNKELMKEFLSRILERNVEDVTFLRSELEVRNTSERVKTVDVLVNVSGKYIHIEMNTSPTPYLHCWNFNYFTTLYNKKTTRGEEYDIYTLFLHLDFTYGMGNNGKIKEEYQVRSKEGTQYISNFKIIEYNMDKIMEFWYSGDEKEILKYKHLMMLDMDKQELEEISRGDAFMEKFQSKLSHLNEDETFQSYMTEEQDRIVCHNTDKRLAYNEGVNEGIEQGAKEKQLEIARVMLKEGDSFEKVARITNLSESELKELKKP